MPYIDPKARPIIDSVLWPVAKVINTFNHMGLGSLMNYVIFRLVTMYAEHTGHWNYRMINDIFGALECCKLELYRRHVAPYEDQAMERNGDICSLPEDNSTKPEQP